MHNITFENINYPVLLNETYHESLDNNDKVFKHWQKLKDEYATLEILLRELPNELTKDVMVPIAPRALMQGKIVHTNEILVCLGQGYFVKRSAVQAAEICKRREKTCCEMLQSLQRERELLIGRQELPLKLDAFSEGNEIIEEYNEEEETHWRAEHRNKEKEYRQKLAELRTKEKTVVNDEESLWQRLDELELQEELEEELDRLHANDSDGEEEVEEEEEEKERNEDERNALNGCGKEIRNDMVRSENEDLEQITESTCSTRRVSFANIDDYKKSAEELRIFFQHSDAIEPRGTNPIESPAQLYLHFKEKFHLGPKSILKITDDENIDTKLSESEDSDAQGNLSNDEIKYESSISLPPPVLEEITERSVPTNSQPFTTDRPVSRFRALRQKNKQ